MVLDIGGVLGLSKKKNSHKNKKYLFNLSLKMRILHQKREICKKKERFSWQCKPIQFAS